MSTERDEIAALLCPYLDGELSATQRQQVEDHLAHCPSCRAELEELRMAGLLLVPSDGGPKAADLEVGLRQRMRQQVGRMLLRVLVVGGLIAIVLANIPQVAASLRPELPLWFRLCRLVALALLGGPILLWVYEVLGDVTSLVVYNWLSQDRGR